MLGMDDSGAQAPSQGGWDGIDDEFMDDPLKMRSGDRSVAPPTPGTKGDRAESQAPRRSLGQALSGNPSGMADPPPSSDPASNATIADNLGPPAPMQRMTDTIKTAPMMQRMTVQTKFAPNPTRPITPAPQTASPAAPDPMTIARTAPRQPLSAAPTPDVPAPAMSGVLGGIDQSKLPDFVNGVRSQVPGRGADEAIGRIPQPPVAPNHADLVKQEADLSKPVDPRAVGPDGKPMYRMGIGQRIIGTVANFANGFARNGQPVIHVGPGATNNRYATDVSQRAGQLEGVEKQLGRQEKDTEENRKMYEAATQQALREGQIERLQGQAAKYGNAIDPQSVRQKDDGTWTGTTYGGETKEVGEPAWSQKITAQNDRAENKPPTNEFSGWYSAFKRDNGRVPTAKDIQAYETSKARAGKDTSAADLAKTIQIAEYKGKQADKINTERETERQRRYADRDKEIAANPVLKAQYMSDTNKLAQEHQQIDADLETKYGKRLQDASDEADKLFGLTKAGKKLQSQNSASTSTTPPASGAAKPQVSAPAAQGLKPPKAGTELTDRGIAKQYLQKAGGDAKKAQTLAQNDGWKVSAKGKR